MLGSFFYYHNKILTSLVSSSSVKDFAISCKDFVVGISELEVEPFTSDKCWVVWAYVDRSFDELEQFIFGTFNGCVP
jgi:hypothetical protein